GTISVEKAKQALATYEDFGFAKVDHHRKKRQGFPEIIYGEGKTVEQMVTILQAIKEKQNNVLITRISSEKANSIRKIHPEFTYHQASEILYWKNKQKQEEKSDSFIAVICAGTSDLRVAEEAA